MSSKKWVMSAVYPPECRQASAVFTLTLWQCWCVQIQQKGNGQWVNTIFSTLPFSTAYLLYFFNLCSPLCVYARYICTNLIVYFVNKRGFPLKSTQMGKWDLSQGNGTAYKSSFMQSVLLYGRQKEPLPTQTCKDLNILYI